MEKISTLISTLIAVIALVVSGFSAFFAAEQERDSAAALKLTEKPVLFLSCHEDNIKTPTSDELRYVLAIGMGNEAPGFQFVDFTNPVTGPSGKFVRLPFVVSRCMLSNQGQLAVVGGSLDFRTKMGTLPSDAVFTNTVPMAFGALPPGASFSFLVANLSMSPQWVQAPSDVTLLNTALESATTVGLYRDIGAAKMMDQVTLPPPTSCYEPGPGAFHLQGTFHQVIGRPECAKQDGNDAGHPEATFSK
jgi:hypothetical protein